MGTGPGLTLSAQLSQARAFLSATNLKCSDGNEYALAGGGKLTQTGYTKTVDIYTNDDILTRTNDNFEGPARSSLAATTISCNDGNEYALFGGGSYFDGITVYSNDVDVFACNADGVYQKQRIQFTGPGRFALASTTISCNDGNEYALFAGGGIDNEYFLNDVDVFACNEDGVYQNDKFQFTGPGREALAATTISCPDGKQYALFGGGIYGENFSNDVDVFACNADGVYHEKLTQFTGPARSSLAATTIRCNDGNEYALFAGGIYSFVDTSNDVDVFACNADGVYHEKLTQFKGIKRSNLAATTITCSNGNQYALFGGGGYRDNGDNIISNDVDVFACNADGVYHKQLTQFTGPARANLAATTITIDGKQYALFMGGQTADGFSDVIDIYDCETGGFLPQLSP